MFEILGHLPYYFFCIEIPAVNANSVDPAQMPCSATSDLGLHYLPITLLGVYRLKWVRVPITTVAADIFILFLLFNKKGLTLHVNFLLIHMKCQTLFSLKNNYLRMSSAAILLGTLRVKLEMSPKDTDAPARMTNTYC